MLRKWDNIPEFMRNAEVKYYWELLMKKRRQLAIKRMFDIVASAIFLLVLAIPMLIIAISIRLNSEGSVFYRQERVTAYGKRFRIHKFRTMISNADKVGSQITTENDTRITGIGQYLRKLRLDELPQLIDIFVGNMTFVGVRPEVPQFVECYSNEMLATLLLPAGVTGEACIKFNGIEQRIMEKSINIEKDYREIILPQKMKYNLKQISEFSLLQEVIILFKTVIAVIV